MAHQRLPSTLPTKLRDAGLKVVVLADWHQRGRPESTGGFDPKGVLWHHTGGAGDGRDYAQWMATTGRDDLPPPLCQLSVGRDGTVYVIAGGRANHAGKAVASGPMPAGDGNALYVGVECHNTGSEGWPKKQRKAMVALGVALSQVLGCAADTHRAHKETSTTGKWDPGKLDMTAFRADIAAGLAKAARPRTYPNADKMLAAALKGKQAAEAQHAKHKAAGHPKRAAIAAARAAAFTNAAKIARQLGGKEK